MRIEIVSTEETEDDRFRVMLRKTMDDGSVEEGSHIFPKDILEWRAAEYGIDPSDVDTLLDIVITEPYLSAEDWVGPKLYDEGVTTEEARAAHLARCAKVKLTHRVSTRARKDSPLQHVRDKHQMDAEAIHVKRQLVGATREHIRQAAKASRAPDARVAELRVALNSLRRGEV